jgi:hypothetical protein
VPNRTADPRVFVRKFDYKTSGIIEMSLNCNQLNSGQKERNARFFKIYINWMSYLVEQFALLCQLAIENPDFQLFIDDHPRNQRTYLFLLNTL